MTMRAISRQRRPSIRLALLWATLMRSPVERCLSLNILSQVEEIPDHDLKLFEGLSEDDDVDLLSYHYSDEIVDELVALEYEFYQSSSKRLPRDCPRKLKAKVACSELPLGMLHVWYIDF